MTTQNLPTLTDEHCLKEFGWTKGQFETIRKMYLNKLSPDEIKVFGYVCKQTGLNPMLKQIYAIVRNTKAGPVMTIQTAIDGYRLIAERTGKYSPGKETVYKYDENQRVFSATAFVKKMTSDGTWHEVGATAFLREYLPSHANDFWNSKPHIMLSKCAEALAIRKAFPAELSAVYTKEEMDQADLEDVSLLTKIECEDVTQKPAKIEHVPEAIAPVAPIAEDIGNDLISVDQLLLLSELFEKTDDVFKENFDNHMRNVWQVQGFCNLPKVHFDFVKERMEINANKNKAVK